MAYSVEPGRKTAYSEDLRWRVVWKRLCCEMSYRGIAQSLNISVHNVWDTFVATGDVSAKKAPVRVAQRVLDDYHEILVIGLLLNQPDMYLRELCQHITNTTGVIVSEPTICRILRKHGLTRKKIRQVAVQRCSVMRGQFMAEMSLFSSEQLVWIDETGCRNKDCIRAAGYALRGMTPVHTRFLAKGRRVSCIAAIAHDGLVAVETTRDSVDSTVFFNFVRGSLIPNMLPFDGSNPRSVAILDNCSIHHVESVREIFRQAGVLLFYLPAYSPDLNPIELAFSKVKYYLKEHDELVQSTPNPIPIITAAFNTITTEDCMNWITYCGYGD